ncbi:MAG: LysM peptidoglycan-binding domain-containing protein [Hyphomicrobium sp.]
MRLIQFMALLALLPIGGCTLNERPDFSEDLPEKPAIRAKEERQQSTISAPIESLRADITPKPGEADAGWSARDARPVGAGVFESHVVRQGDTLYRIAQERGVSLSMLYSANGLMNDRLTPGQHLLIPPRSELKQ